MSHVRRRARTTLYNGVRAEFEGVRGESEFELQGSADCTYAYSPALDSCHCTSSMHPRALYPSGRCLHRRGVSRPCRPQVQQIWPDSRTLNLPLPRVVEVAAEDERGRRCNN